MASNYILLFYIASAVSGKRGRSPNCKCRFDHIPKQLSPRDHQSKREFNREPINYINIIINHRVKSEVILYYRRFLTYFRHYIFQNSSS